MTDREFQLVLYGATGFTGRLGIKYLTKQYGGSIRWAIAGRSESKLQQLAKECDPAPSVIVASADDVEALRNMAARTAAVAACAGPFARLGSNLVEACVKESTGYCDITGEVHWVRQMIAVHHDAAAASGAHIVHLCGHDSIPWDLTTLMLAKKLREAGEDLAFVDMYTDIRSSPSGGTLETAMGIFFGKDGQAKHPAVKALGYDPLLKQNAGAGKSANAVSARNVTALDWTSPPRTFFFMAGVNANAVKRSNALNGYGPKVVYREGQVCRNVLAGIIHLLGMALFGFLLIWIPTRWLLRKFVLPQPGEGPSEAYMDSGYLILEGRAKGSKGSKICSKMSFAVDPGYKDTARMVIEAALALSLDRDKISVPGGVYTPAACQGEILLDRLVKTGTTFEYL